MPFNLSYYKYFQPSSYPTLKEALAQHMATHQNPVNKTIHITTYPIITNCVLILCAYIPFTITFTFWDNTFVSNMLALSPSLIVIIPYLLLYMSFDVIATFVLIPFLFVVYIVANMIRFYVPYAWIASILLHILSWIAQGIGHCAFDKETASKSLNEKTVKLYFMHPFFVFMEMLFLFGYKKDLYAELANIVREHDSIMEH